MKHLYLEIAAKKILYSQIRDVEELIQGGSAFSKLLMMPFVDPCQIIHFVLYSI
jgi:hypothetical protein